MADPIELGRPELLGPCRRDPAPAPLEAGAWLVADETDAGLRYELPYGILRSDRFLWTDLLLDGTDLAVFELSLHEDRGAVFRLMFGALAQCQARVRVPLSVTDFNRWRLDREGAWLKPICFGEAVDLPQVRWMELRMVRHNGDPVRWCMTPLRVLDAAPPKLDHPLLPRGPLLDELGQSTLHDWPTRSKDEHEVRDRLQQQRSLAESAEWPDGFSRWGGWQTADRIAEPTGFFGTHHDGRRWWLVDPAGYRFWSSGVDCVVPHVAGHVDGLTDALTGNPDSGGNFLVSNLRNTFGDRWRTEWEQITVGLLKQYGFTTIGNWSDIDLAKRAQFSYVRPLQLNCRRTPMIYRDFPDVFDPSFAEDADDYAAALSSTRDDPALIGYFLMNEPTWGFAQETPAAGMLRTSGPCASRVAFREFLTERYATDAELSEAWGHQDTLEEISTHRWTGGFTAAAEHDLEEFSTVLVAKLFGQLSAACRAVDPHHLNLGARYYTVPPAWALSGMGDFDVFSLNCYRERVPAETMQELSDQTGCPVMIGEWHFGALDAGLPASGIGHVPDQTARGQAFRAYTEHAASQPWCVGVHYFTLYDQSAIGRFDGENYNIGLIDVCHRPYDPVVDAAHEAHTRMYRVAAGEVTPYSDAPTYLPKLFI
ncbi:hypothetical protein [Microlunatus parietis]|uniref:Beta-galactosidase n=1 Tax=Microlunatus parietis TaxID=682979 RepID=A0A7Y9IE20_9ACTN|nr:hypothetical protein [Microlunatus parietis]NYE74524.1 hypothetical protein [Microlunatus parietis]